MKNKYIFCFEIFLLSLVLPLTGQTGASGKYISQAPPEGGKITDEHSVSLMPGFNFHADLTKWLLVMIEKNSGGTKTKPHPSDHNYIHTCTFLDKYGDSSIDAIQYYDGLGRPDQLVQAGITPTFGDLVSLQEYDSHGRDFKSWLPGVFAADNKGKYIDDRKMLKDMIVKTNQSDTAPYSMPIYEPSPLNRVIEQYGPGQDWYNKGKAINTAYLTNDSSDSLKCINYITTDDRKVIDIKNNGYYPDGELYVTRITDEDGNIAYEFKDKLDQVLLTRQINAGENYDTYYIFDSYGNLRAVYPPMNTDESNILHSDIAFLYKYDDRNRCIAKKLPGADWMYYVYDHADRLIFSQDGQQRTQNEWVYSIPDAFGRIAQTGTCSNSLNYESNPLKDVVVKASWNKDSKTYDIDGVSLSGKKILTENYYDNYGFAPSQLAYISKTGYDMPYDNAQGLLTGNKIALYDEDKTLLTAVYYDDKGRAVQTRTENNMGGYDVEYIAYTFTGEPKERLHEHSTASGTTSEQVKYEYDHAMRLLTVLYQKDNEARICLVENLYDDLGRLQSSKKADNEMLKTEYAYNIRSWTQEMKGSLFSQKLAYSYNGNITKMDWKNGSGAWQDYTFDYDNLSRLTNAKHNAATEHNRSYGYDMRGNMLAMNGKSFAYKGNQLTDSKIAYDRNGAVTKDLTKGISKIQYNLLNLPEEVVTSTGTVKYTYAADGRKLKAGDTEYAGNFIYENGKLKRILIDGGYIEDGKYYFYLTDHLSNNRVVADKDGNVIQTNDYDPFGATLASNDKQPYKYNGKEEDKSLKMYDYSARYYDGNGLPKFSTMDPMAEKYYSISPYAYCANNPLKFIDLTGEEIIIYYFNEKGKQTTWAFNGKNYQDLPNNKFIYNVIMAYSYNIANGGGDKLYEAATSNNLKINIAETKDGSRRATGAINIIVNGRERSRNKSFVLWNPKLGSQDENGKIISPATILEHEVDHAIGYETDEHFMKNQVIGSDEQYNTKEERRVITGSEAKTAQANKEFPKGYVRPSHKGTPVETYGVTSNLKKNEKLD